MKQTILKYALQNAVKFKGKAHPGAVIGKVLAENPELKKTAKKIIGETKKIVDKVNSLSLEKQKKELEKYSDSLKEAVREEKDIFSMFEIKENEEVVTAFPPEPSKYPHIGHAKALFLNYELAKRNNGKFILRFEDTNPKLADKEFYKIHLENYEWLGIKADEVTYASDYMDDFYDLAKRMLKKGYAYVCTCSQEKIKKDRFEGKECTCRYLMEDKHLKRFEELFNSAEGKMVLRLKGYMQHQNTTMRDPALLRVIKHKHPRHGSKYHVWPTYDFENAAMDGLQGITHRLRTKEFELRNELQNHVQTTLGFKNTKIYEFARFNLEGVESSGRVIRDLIKKKKLVGWDDPSLTTIAALKRRGFLPEAIKNFVLSTGITKSESVLTWDDLIVHNKRILDAQADRYFFIKDAKEIKIENAPTQDVKLKLHPEFEDRDFREYKVKDSFFIEKDDFKNFKNNKLYRLMDCLNFTKKRDKFVFHSSEHEKFKKKGHLIIHWLPKQKDLVKTEVLMPDKKLVKGIAEPATKKLKENEVIQFQRFGFCRLDKKEKNRLSFWYSHK
ncbi:glutamate--tRNA ligase [Candidatus Woesearchaeota archaeon]|nr:glutamate--tRNA ligase [Candidatus Woesearchaeota archaeon]|tara:strand:+ start:3087 stop:4757 length:1671 start_codon:yes stop_codon:yes gene_type:complete